MADLYALMLVSAFQVRASSVQRFPVCPDAVEALGGPALSRHSATLVPTSQLICN